MISRLDTASENRACHAAKIDPEVLNLCAVRYGQVSGHADQNFVQRQARRSKRDELAPFHASEIMHLVRPGNAGKDVLRAVDCAKPAQQGRHLRDDSRVPRTEWQCDNSRINHRFFALVQALSFPLTASTFALFPRPPYARMRHLTTRRWSDGSTNSRRLSH